MNSLVLKTVVIGVVVGASYGVYAIGLGDQFSFSVGKDGMSFEVPEAVTFEEIEKKIEVAKEKIEELKPLVVPEEVPVEVVSETPAQSVEVPVEELVVDVTPEETSGLPESVNLAVPFTPQAPFANWDEIHEETCEEASVLMVHAYYEGKVKGVVDPAIADDVITDMVEREMEIFGYFEDTTVRETAEFASLYYGYEKTEILEQPTINEIKEHLAAGRPVIVPTSGRILANPFYSGIGPIYHMVVIKGYTEKGFIVNDPGTRRGADWIYSYDHLMQSIHDWVVPEGIEDHPEDIPVLSKVALVIYPN